MAVQIASTLIKSTPLLLSFQPHFMKLFLAEIWDSDCIVCKLAAMSVWGLTVWPVTPWNACNVICHTAGYKRLTRPTGHSVYYTLFQETIYAKSGRLTSLWLFIFVFVLTDRLFLCVTTNFNIQHRPHSLVYRNVFIGHLPEQYVTNGHFIGWTVHYNKPWVWRQIFILSVWMPWNSYHAPLAASPELAEVSCSPREVRNSIHKYYGSLAIDFTLWILVSLESKSRCSWNILGILSLPHG